MFLENTGVAGAAGLLNRDHLLGNDRKDFKLNSVELITHLPARNLIAGLMISVMQSDIRERVKLIPSITWVIETAPGAGARDSFEKLSHCLVHRGKKNLRNLKLTKKI